MFAAAMRHRIWLITLPLLHICRGVIFQCKQSNQFYLYYIIYTFMST